MLKRVFSLLLAGLMLTSTVACAKTNDTSEDTLKSTVAVSEEADTDLKPDLPQKNYGEAEFRILTDSDDNYEYLVAEKTDGELVNDAIFEANMSVANQFNIVFTHVEGTPDTFIMSGDDEYDVAYLHDCTTATKSLRRWFLNVYDVPYMDPTMPWWPQFSVESLTLNGKMLFYSNYTGYKAMEQTRVCFFNQRILENYNMESPYDLVREGTWTLDAIIKMSSAIYEDLNGNGMSDSEDLMGFATANYPWGWMEAFGIELYRKESSNSPTLNVEVDERVYTLVDKLHEWYFSGTDGVMAEFNGHGEPGISMFAADRVAFTFVNNIATQVRPAIEANVPYGILPFPKIDQNQKQYYGACTDYIFSIPITLRDTERAGVILEAMAYAGYKYVRPAYCEQTLKTRFATDPDCAEMLNLIFDNQVISFTYLYSEAVSGGMQSTLIAKTVANKNVASIVQSRQKAEQKFLKQIARVYEDS